MESQENQSNNNDNSANQSELHEWKVKRLAIKGPNRAKGECGLPKYAVDELIVQLPGAKGDYNHYRTISKKSDPNRAISIMTTDAIKRLNEEGWPVQDGDMGENITIEAHDYDAMAIGTKWKIGEVSLEITESINPCSKLGTLPYVGKEKKRSFQKTLKGRRGWYAKVLEEGTIRVGESVIQIPVAPLHKRKREDEQD